MDHSNFYFVTLEEHRETRERKRRAECPPVGVGPSVWSESGA